MDIVLSRIGEIEQRMTLIDQRFNALFDFEKVLNEKKVEIKKEPPQKQDKDIKSLVEKYATENNIDKNLVDAVIKTESNYDKNAVSHAGALGLMQLMPMTAQSLGVEDPFDPEQNISGGTKYLKSLINRYNSVELGLAAYNAGPASVNKYGGVPPYEETRNYIRKVMEFQNDKRH